MDVIPLHTHHYGVKASASVGHLFTWWCMNHLGTFKTKENKTNGCNISLCIIWMNNFRLNIKSDIFYYILYIIYWSCPLHECIIYALIVTKFLMNNILYIIWKIYRKTQISILFELLLFLFSTILSYSEPCRACANSRH